MIDPSKLPPEAKFIYDCRNPFFYLKGMWGLTPQPAKPEFAEFIENADPVEWEAKHFGNSKRIDLPNGKYYMKWEWYDGNGGWIDDRDDFIARKWITWQQGAALTSVKLHTESLGDKIALEQFLGYLSIASGHGIGKSAFLSWIILWYLFTFPDCQIAATAPSKQQMFDILWKELSVWIRRMPKIYQDIYEWQSAYVRINKNPEAWFARAATAKKENPEALAGVHGEHVLLVADEASGVEDIIFQTAEGAATGGHVMFIMISNPTRNKGYFSDSHNKDSEDWINFSFNCEESPVVDETYLIKQSRKYSRTSDNYRIRVLGLPPHREVMDDKGYMSLITEKEIRDAFVPKDTPFKARKLGVDPAGEGGDPASWVGADTNLMKILHEEHISTPTSGATKTLTLATEHEIAGGMINLDCFGTGSKWLPFVNRAGLAVEGLNSGDFSKNKDYQNLRAEGAWLFREFIKRGGQLVEHEGWIECANIEYRRNIKGQIQIKPKLEMKKERIPSPNNFDAGCYSLLGAEASAAASVEAIEEETRKYEAIVKGNQLSRYQ